MRIKSFQDMLPEYGVEGLDSEDKIQREELLANYQYSIIVEGEFMEFDNLFKWIKLNTNEHSVKDLFYGKIGYDYGFAEFFFNENEYLPKLTQAIPNIYTVYPKAYPAKRICKSDGYEVLVEYSVSDKDAILFAEE